MKINTPGGLDPRRKGPQQIGPPEVAALRSQVVSTGVFSGHTLKWVSMLANTQEKWDDLVEFMGQYIHVPLHLRTLPKFLVRRHILHDLMFDSPDREFKDFRNGCQYLTETGAAVGGSSRTRVSGLGTGRVWGDSGRAIRRAKGRGLQDRVGEGSGVSGGRDHKDGDLSGQEG